MFFGARNREDIIKQGTPDPKITFGRRQEGPYPPADVNKGIAHRRQRGVHRRKRDWTNRLTFTIASTLLSLALFVPMLVLCIQRGHRASLSGSGRNFTVLSGLVLSGSLLAAVIIINLVLYLKPRRGDQGPPEEPS